jgi:aminopeptidase N
MDLYFARHDGDAATVEDFIACFEDASGRDLKQFMTWYAQAGTPEIVCELKHDAAGRTAELTLSQVLPSTPGEAKKKPLHIPVKLGLLGEDGRDLPLLLASGDRVSGGLIELRKRVEKFKFRDIAKRPVPSVLREFSAPANLTLQRSDDDLRFLMMHDSDLFNRWQAAQDYGTRVLLDAVSAQRKGDRPGKPDAFIDALAGTLSDDSLEPAYRAQFLALPSESDLARVIGKDVDPLAIHKARKVLRKAVGTRLHQGLSQVYRGIETKGPYSPAAGPAGRRALRNVALGYLTSRGRPDDIARAAQHFSNSKNLTDEIAGLSVLSETSTPERAKAFDRFFERWEDDHLVIDSWFTYQAVTPQPSALATVKKLMRHPTFSMENPNKVRALIFAFAMANPVNFNRPDGSGYAFVADRVLEIDRFNPQIAARLLSCFRSWKALEPERRRVAKKTIQQLLKAKPLSADVYEIASKMLD